MVEAGQARMQPAAPRMPLRPSPCAARLATSSPPLQVSYEILIPAMLFSKVASTLAAQPDAMLLCGISAAALLQIALGAACGLALTWLFGLGKPAQQQPGPAGGSASSWQGRTSPAAASAIALSLASASGAPAAAPALRLKQPAPVAGEAGKGCGCRQLLLPAPPSALSACSAAPP